MAFDAGLWAPAFAVVLMGIGLAVGLIFYGAGRVRKVRRVRSFIGGETATPAPTHFTGASFYLTVRNLPVVRGIYGDAEREAFDLYRVVGQYSQGLVKWLRSLHTGVLETYATWVLAGAVAVAALVFLLS